MKRIWIYSCLCHACDSRYDVEPTEIVIGPLHETRLGKLVEMEPSDLIPRIEKEHLFTGEIHVRYCPCCFLRVHYPDKMPVKQWDEWLRQNDERIVDDPIIAYFINYKMKSDDYVSFAHVGELLCPRCDYSMGQEYDQRICSKCGSNQVKLLGSKSIEMS